MFDHHSDSERQAFRLGEAFVRVKIVGKALDIRAQDKASRPARNLIHQGFVKTQ